MSESSTVDKIKKAINFVLALLPYYLLLFMYKIFWRQKKSKITGFAGYFARAQVLPV